MCHKSISELSPKLQESARKNEQLILNRLSNSCQKTVGDLIGLKEPSMSKLKSEGRIEFIAVLLSAMGMKVVDERDLYCSPEIAEATRQMLANCFTSPDYVHIMFNGAKK